MSSEEAPGVGVRFLAAIVSYSLAAVVVACLVAKYAVAMSWIYVKYGLLCRLTERLSNE